MLELVMTALKILFYIVGGITAIFLSAFIIIVMVAVYRVARGKDRIALKKQNGGDDTIEYDERVVAVLKPANKKQQVIDEHHKGFRMFKK